jgi:hypothetical protein
LDGQARRAAHVVYYATKILISAALVVLVAELAKRSSLAGAILASIPLVSVLAMIWLYMDTHDVAQVASLARGIFWLVLPSLALFLALPLLLQRGFGFYVSLAISIGVTVIAYFGMVVVSRYFGVRL